MLKIILTTLEIVYLGNEEIVELLLQSGAVDVNKVNKVGRTLLYQASMKGEFEYQKIVRTLSILNFKSVNVTAIDK